MEAIDRSTAAFSREEEACREAFVRGFSEVDTQGAFDAGGFYDMDVRDSRVPIGTTLEDIAHIGRRYATILTLAAEVSPGMQDLMSAGPDMSAEPWEKDDPLGPFFGGDASVTGVHSGCRPEVSGRGLAHACRSLSDADGGLLAEGFPCEWEAIRSLLDDCDESLEVAR